MTGDPESTDADEEFGPMLRDPHALAWARENLPQLRRSVSQQRVLRWSLAIGFLLGLVAHVGGYLLKATEPEEPLALVVDLLYEFGAVLWTGVVVVIFLQLYPETKTRQIKRAADAFEAALRAQERTPDGTRTGEDEAPSPPSSPDR